VRAEIPRRSTPSAPTSSTCTSVADGAAIGEGSLRDFRLLAGVVGGLDGGVYLNLGSAVVMPEVFVKALNLARNVGRPVRRLTTVDMDFIRHYRPG
jgi:hypothetical protein